MFDGAALGEFLGGLVPHRFCIRCLAKLLDQRERPIRRALQALAGRLESRMDECRNCTQTRRTYRIAN